MKKLEVNGHVYGIGKLNPLIQFHIARRLAPLFAVMGISLMSLKEGAEATVDDFIPMMEPIMQMMGKMSDDDANYVLYSALRVVNREQAMDRWAPITSSGGNNIMFDDIDMPTMLRLVFEVLKDNLGSFLMGLDDVKSSPSP